ncbi:60S ribosomal protein L37a-like [Cervus canadensis]|uniref:60S ribosomal protein L37a-like n=1 Tax=Cervus canadensis TaxID=1574408 RepID=UPI001C9E7EAF|nr:60S ribosomal protein L37a-like [Cervus canadensis]
MMKRTEEVRIMGKYRTHPSASLRKMVRKIELSQHANYTCSFCGKTKMMRRAGVIWLCGSRMRAVAGGAWTHSTPSAITGEPAVRRLEELKGRQERHHLITLLLLLLTER